VLFDFDAYGEPPKQLICGATSGVFGGTGAAVLKVFEEPSIKEGKGEWSWEEEDWNPSPLAERIIDLLNRE